MYRSRRLSIGLLLSLWVPSASAIDLPHGSDGLPQLASDATMVIAVAGVEEQALPEGARVSLFSVEVTEVYKGDDITGSRIFIMAPASLGTIPASEFKGSAVFLRGPLGEKELGFWELPPDRQIFQLVAGGLGLVKLNPERSRAIKRYVSLADAGGDAAGISWAKEYIDRETDDHFLQKSIVYELERHPESPRALEFLGWATRLQWMDLAQRSLAIEALSRNGSETALEKLIDTAEDKRIRLDVRSLVIEEVAGHDEASEVLVDWAGSKDRFLSGEAKKVLAGTPDG